MHSDLPKVVHEVAGEPMVRWVVKAAREIGIDAVQFESREQIEREMRDRGIAW